MKKIITVLTILGLMVASLAMPMIASSANGFADSPDSLPTIPETSLL